MNVLAVQLSRKIPYAPMCPVKINGVLVEGLVDSGNTVSNAISASFAERLGLSLADQTIRPLPNLKTVGTAKRGSELKILGIPARKVQIRLGNHPEVLWDRPLIIEGLTSDVNISGPFLTKHKIDQLHSKKALAFKGKLISLEYRKQRTDWKEAEKEYPEEISCTEKPRFTSGAYLDRQYRIPANSGGFIRLRLPRAEVSELTKPIEGYLQAYPAFVTRTKVCPALQALVRIDENGCAHTTVLNPTDQEVVLQGGTQFGHFFEAPPSDQRRRDGQFLSTLELIQGQTLAEMTITSPKSKSRWTNQQLISLFRLQDSPWLKEEPTTMKAVLDLLHEYADIISDNDQYGCTDLVEHEINLQPEATPIRTKVRPINPVLEKNLKEQLDTWLKQEVIEASTSPWSFPLVPVPKKNGKVRWCVDYRKLNQVTIKDTFPLPNIEDNLTRMANSRVYSAIDSAGAYHVVKIRKEDREKTAFATHQGLFHFIRLPFGLCNAPATYSRLVQKVMAGLPPEMVLAYLDDTCIHTHDTNTHLQVMRQVFQAYRQAGLTLQPEKCHLFQEEIEYLGHKVSAKGVSVMPKYVEVIQEWPEPTTISEVRTFMGKASYYRKFIAGFSKIAAPLTDLIKKVGDKKNGPVEMTADSRRAFQVLKDKLMSAPILAYPRFESDEPFIVDTDWSKDPGAIGGVLSQRQDGEERVICYGARKLTKGEKNYSSNKGELAAVIHFLRQWKYYLQGRPFILRTDHQALKWIKSMEEPNGMILRWLETLGNFDFTVEFRKGPQHGNADALSRTEHGSEPTPKEDLHDDQTEVDRLNWPRDFRDEGQKKAEVSSVMVRYLAKEPVDWKVKQQQDPILGQVRRWIELGRAPDTKDLRAGDPDLQRYSQIKETLCLCPKGWLRTTMGVEECRQPRICVPRNEQEILVKHYHQQGGHLGRDITRKRVLEKYYFPGSYNVIDQVVAECAVCQKKKNKARDQRHTLVSTQEGYPFQKISIDLVGPMLPSTNGNKYILTVKDTFTRWIEAFPMKSTTAVHVAKILEKEIFSRYGMPRQIHSDQGPQFMSDFILDLYRELGIKGTQTPAYNPKSNPVERSHKDLGSILTALAMSNEGDWEDNLPAALLALRTAKNKRTGVTPHFALFGREAVLPVDLVYGLDPDSVRSPRDYSYELKTRMTQAFAMMRNKLQNAIARSSHAYGGSNPDPLQPGDVVWLYTPALKARKLQSGWTGPWIIQKKISDVLFQIKTGEGWDRPKTATVGVDRLKRYKGYQGPMVSKRPAQSFQVEDEFLEQPVGPDDLPQPTREMAHPDPDQPRGHIFHGTQINVPLDFHQTFVMGDRRPEPSATTSPDMNPQTTPTSPLANSGTIEDRPDDVDVTQPPTSEPMTPPMDSTPPGDPPRKSEPKEVTSKEPIRVYRLRIPNVPPRIEDEGNPTIDFPPEPAPKVLPIRVQLPLTPHRLTPTLEPLRTRPKSLPDHAKRLVIPPVDLTRHRPPQRGKSRIQPSLGWRQQMENPNYSSTSSPTTTTPMTSPETPQPMRPVTWVMKEPTTEPTIEMPHSEDEEEIYGKQPPRAIPWTPEEDDYERLTPTAPPYETEDEAEPEQEPLAIEYAPEEPATTTTTAPEAVLRRSTRRKVIKRDPDYVYYHPGTLVDDDGDANFQPMEEDNREEDSLDEETWSNKRPRLESIWIEIIPERS